MQISAATFLAAAQAAHAAQSAPAAARSAPAAPQKPEFARHLDATPAADGFEPVSFRQAAPQSAAPRAIPAAAQPAQGYSPASRPGARLDITV